MTGDLLNYAGCKRGAQRATPLPGPACPGQQSHLGGPFSSQKQGECCQNLSREVCRLPRRVTKIQRPKEPKARKMANQARKGFKTR